MFTKPTTINWDYSYGPRTLSPVTGRRLDYIILLWDVSMTDVTKNSRLIAVTSSTCSTLLLAMCVKTVFPPIDVQHTQRPCRFVVQETSALSQSQASRQTYKCIACTTRYPVHMRYPHAYGVRVVFLGHGGGALGIFYLPALCVFKTVFSTHRHPAHAVSVPIFHARLSSVSRKVRDKPMCGVGCSVWRPGGGVGEKNRWRNRR